MRTASSAAAQQGKLDGQERPGSTTFARAISGYDQAFQQTLADAIIMAIANTSRLSDTPVIALRIGETAEALIMVLEAILASSPHFDHPGTLRRFAEKTAKRLRRNVAKLRADPNYAANIFDARRGGNA
jgi:glyoxylase-like metal-dependent hydrolase (beta-lactamase superfamily II)